MYWRLLAINPAVAGEIVLVEKPAITTDSDRMDRGALDQLLLHTGTLGSIYHKNPEVTPLLYSASFKDLSFSFLTDIHPWSGRTPANRHPGPQPNLPADVSYRCSSECF